MNRTTAGSPVTASGDGQPGDRIRKLRWRLRRVYAGLRYGQSALARAPILFGNSFPKSGTHLLAQVLLAFPRIGLAVDRGMGPILTFERGTGRRRAPGEILTDLDALRAGDLCFGHVTADPEIVEAWCRDGVVHFFVLRDPRDAAVSHAFYIGDKAVHNVHHAFYQSLASLEDRLRVSILGRPDFPGEFPDIRTRYAWYLDWLDCPGVHLIRFEDLVTDREATLARMLDYAEGRGFQRRVSRDRALALMAEAIDPGRSYTFRSGKTGEWQEHFSAEHKELFKATAGDLLVRLGYAEDQGW